MMVNFLAVVGSYMVGTKAWKGIAFYLAQLQQDLKITDSGATPDPLPLSRILVLLFSYAGIAFGTYSTATPCRVSAV